MGSVYRIGEFAQRIGRSAGTVRRWEAEGRLTAKRTTSGQRYFDEADVRAALNIDLPDLPRRRVVYCRVSSPGQKDDLTLQVTAMELLSTRPQRSSPRTSPRRSPDAKRWAGT